MKRGFLTSLPSLFVALCALMVSATAASAQTALPVNGSVGGSLSAGGKDTIYTFTPTKDGDVTFTVTPSSGLYASIYFYDSDGLTNEVNAGGSDYGKPVVLTVGHLGPGATYYVRVYDNAGSGTFTLSNTYTPVTVANDSEPNDTLIYGEPLGTAPTNSQFPLTGTGRLGYSRSSYTDTDRYDCYTVTVPADGDLTVSVTPSSGLYINLYLYDTDGVSNLTGVGGGDYGGTATSTIVHVGPGTYYFYVQDVVGYGTYSIKAYVTPQTAPNDTTEPNDLVTQADDHGAVPTDPMHPLVKRGHIGYSRTSYNDTDRSDWYTLSIPTDGDLTVSVVPTSNTLYPYLYLYNTDGTSYLTSSNGGDYGTTATSTLVHIGPGTYYAYVYNGAGYGAYTLNAYVTPAALANDAESNDISTQPDTFPVLSTDPNNPTSVTGHLGYSRTSYSDQDTDDWYAVTIPADGDMTVTATPTSNTLYISLYFYDVDAASNRVSASSPTYGKPASILVPHVGPQTYYVRVRGSGYGSYTLNAALTEPTEAGDTENNDISKKAVNLGILPTDPNNPFTTTGHLGYSRTSYTDLDSNDWYVVTIPKDGDLIATVTPTSATLNTYIYTYNTDGSQNLTGVGSGGYGLPVSTTLTHVGPGTYYIRVYNAGGYGTYTLTAYVAAQQFANDAEPNDIYLKSIPFTAQTGSQTGHLGYSRTSYYDQDASDWYSFTATPGNFTLTVAPAPTLAVGVTLYTINDFSAPGLAGVSTNYGTPGTLSYNITTAGTYYLQVRDNGGYGAYIFNPSTITGAVALDAVSDLTAVKQPVGPLTFDLRPIGSTTPTYTFNQALTAAAGSPNGTFTLYVPRGKYDLAIKNSIYLRSLVSNVNAMGSTVAIPGVTTLGAGDADNNNAVNFDDFIILLNAFGTAYDANNLGNGYDATADFNYDGKVNFDDFLAQLNNFGTQGAPPVP